MQMKDLFYIRYMSSTGVHWIIGLLIVIKKTNALLFVIWTNNLGEICIWFLWFREPRQHVAPISKRTNISNHISKNFKLLAISIITTVFVKSHKLLTKYTQTKTKSICEICLKQVTVRNIPRYFYTCYSIIN